MYPPSTLITFAAHGAILRACFEDEAEMLWVFIFVMFSGFSRPFQGRE
jgi:hypothetical protein